MSSCFSPYVHKSCLGGGLLLHPGSLDASVLAVSRLTGVLLLVDIVVK